MDKCLKLISLKLQVVRRGHVFIILSLLFFISCQHGNRTAIDTMPAMISSDQPSKISLELFVMSKCPFGVEVEKTIIPLLDKFNEQVDFHLYFIAQSAEDFLEDTEEREKDLDEAPNFPNPPIDEGEGLCHGEARYEGGNFVSLHGQSEVEEDIRQVVIMKYYPEKFKDYLLYRAENYDTDDWEEAAARAWINIDYVRQISESDEGERLFEENISRSQELNIKSSPILLVNNKRLKGPINLYTLSRNICSSISRHEQCKDVPVCGGDLDCFAAGKAGLCQNPDTPQARCRFADPVDISLQGISPPKIFG